MNSKSSQPQRVAVNLKQLPPIDPFRIMNSSSSKGKLNNSSTRAAAKVVKPSPNQGMKLVHSDEDNPSLGNFVVEDSSNKKNETCGKPISQTVTDSAADEGMKKGSARSNLYEICAANHWKPPIFECYKEEGPSHQRMFTFKVVIEIEEASGNIIECYGAPHRKKKTAADHTAEGALWYLKRRRGLWRKPLKLSYRAHWYYIELLSKHEHCVWCNNCPWLVEHIWMCNKASWVAAHNLCCRHRSVMELNMTARMDNPKKLGLRIISTDPA